MCYCYLYILWVREAESTPHPQQKNKGVHLFYFTEDFMKL